MRAGIDHIGVGCGALIVNERNETLLVKRTSRSKNEAGFWSKPGGTVEFGENVEDAVKREIREELGLDIELTGFLGFTNHFIPSEKQHWIAFNYSARIVKGEPKNLEPQKIGEIRWFGLDDLPDTLTQTTEEAVAAYRASGEAPVHKSRERLRQELRDARKRIAVGGVYVHYKNPEHTYGVLDLGFIESTDEVCVVYRDVEHPELVFVRPLSDWLETVEWHGRKVGRFSPLSPSTTP